MLRVLPHWDLSLVFMALTRAPFEPLQLSAPKFLALKVFFLTLLISGAKLYAILARKVQNNDKGRSITMSPHPSFISTMHQGAPSLRKLVIPALLTHLGCPSLPMLIVRVRPDLSVLILTMI